MLKLGRNIRWVEVLIATRAITKNRNDISRPPRETQTNSKRFNRATCKIRHIFTQDQSNEQVDSCLFV